MLCTLIDDYFFFFFFNDTATTEIYTLSLHDALPISTTPGGREPDVRDAAPLGVTDLLAELLGRGRDLGGDAPRAQPGGNRSEEHTSELQSRQYLVCRLLLEKKKKSNR